jgi:hypothetical protein
MGHDVPAGQNYCPEGHPIALDQFPQSASAAYPGAPAAPSYGSRAEGTNSAKYAQAGAGYGGPSAYGSQPGYAPPAAGYATPGGYAPGAGAGYGAVGEVKPTLAAVPNGLTGFLVSFDANPAGDFWALNGGRYTLGRANSGDTVDIPLADATISSRHAVLDVNAIAATIGVEDTGSTNGTFVNDDHIGFNGRRELRDGDRLRLGGYTTLVKVIARG